MVDLWKGTSQVLGALVGLFVTALMIATFVKWAVWAGAGWLW